MSLARYAKKRDSNEPQIISALESAGAEVWVLDRPVDLLIRFRERWHLMEVKTEKGRLTDEQARFVESTGCPVVRTPVEALRAIGAMA
jgi:hypothetical protein